MSSEQVDAIAYKVWERIIANDGYYDKDYFQQCIREGIEQALEASQQEVEYYQTGIGLMQHHWISPQEYHEIMVKNEEETERLRGWLAYTIGRLCDLQLSLNDDEGRLREALQEGFLDE